MQHEKRLPSKSWRWSPARAHFVRHVRVATITDTNLAKRIFDKDRMNGEGSGKVIRACAAILKSWC
jgi:hypothetical protein